MRHEPLHDHAATGQHSCLVLTGVHGNALLGRVTALMNPFEVTDFGYRLEEDRMRVHMCVCLRGGAEKVERVAGKLRRIVDVLEVTTDVTIRHA